ncbi:hypothetical protein [Zeimonas arvi]|uniref:Uncharacterized protein n=1 Tax=Zeimonas arvi TaxID=2498847 RepID=A0A5C8P0E3_9BURK|nr:hypothetical protein [Zeimonas arvi]TXL67055.1 hypothetical protein FHP08_05400 [Zeimonas arvi]
MEPAISDASSAALFCHASSGDAGVPRESERRKLPIAAGGIGAGAAATGADSFVSNQVPPHRFLGDTKPVIGGDSAARAV